MTELAFFSPKCLPLRSRGKQHKAAPPVFNHKTRSKGLGHREREVGVGIGTGYEALLEETESQRNPRHSCRTVAYTASGDSSTLVFATTTSAGTAGTSVDTNKVVEMLTGGSPQMQCVPTQQQDAYEDCDHCHLDHSSIRTAYT